MKKLLKAANEKNFSEFESIVLEALGEKSTALVEAIRPAVAKKVIAESNTVLKHDGVDAYVFANGDEADVTSEMVKEFVEGKLEVETKIDEAKTLKESILAELRPTVYSPRLAAVLGWKLEEGLNDYGGTPQDTKDFHHIQDYVNGNHGNKKGAAAFAGAVKRKLGVDAHALVLSHQTAGKHPAAIEIADKNMHKHGGSPNTINHGADPTVKESLNESLKPIGHFIKSLANDLREPGSTAQVWHAKTGAAGKMTREEGDKVRVKWHDGSETVEDGRNLNYHNPTF